MKDLPTGPWTGRRGRRYVPDSAEPMRVGEDTLVVAAKTQGQPSGRSVVPTGGRVAIRFYQGSTPESFFEFREETRTLVALGKVVGVPMVPLVYDRVGADDRPGMVLSWCEHSLIDWWANVRKKPSGIEELCTVLTAVSRTVGRIRIALADADLGDGAVPDIRPATLMQDADGAWVLAGFRSKNSPSFPGWTAPEFATGMVSNEASDVWALACCLFACMSEDGSAPPPDRVARAAAIEALSAPDGLKRLLDQALSEDPAARCDGPEALADELAELDLTVAPASPETTMALDDDDDGAKTQVILSGLDEMDFGAHLDGPTDASLALMDFGAHLDGPTDAALPLDVRSLRPPAGPEPVAEPDSDAEPEAGAELDAESEGAADPVAEPEAEPVLEPEDELTLLRARVAELEGASASAPKWMWALLAVVLMGEGVHFGMGMHNQEVSEEKASPSEVVNAPVSVAESVDELSDEEDLTDEEASADEEAPTDEETPTDEEAPTVEETPPVEDAQPRQAAEMEPQVELNEPTPANAAPEPEVEPVPAPAPVKAAPVPAAPRVAAAIPAGGASYTLIGVEGYLQGSGGQVAPGPVAPGTYTLMVRFGEGEFQDSGPVEVSPGAQITIRCGFGQCRVDG